MEVNKGLQHVIIVASMRLEHVSVKTSFVKPSSLFLFGFRRAIRVFQRLSVSLHSFANKRIPIVYIDDVFVSGESFKSTPNK